MTGAAIERPVTGRVYWAPINIEVSGAVPIVYGEHHGVVVDTPSQTVGVVYSSRERAVAAVSDPAVWHPSYLPHVTVCAIVARSARRFEFATVTAGVSA